MSEEETIINCPDCKQSMDITGMRPFTLAKCPHCESLTRVRTNMGNYTIVQKIGIGGMSFVFRASDNVLGRNCALKILNENYFNKPERIASFEKEAQLMAMLHHPNVINVYSVGQSHGHFYIAMELVEGSDVETLIQNNKFVPEAEALRIIMQVAEGLAAAQRAGLLHRDMKPANILLTKNGTAKIVDFGLSLLQSDKNIEKEIWITPYYAPPETLKREAEDERSDIYALGATLYHMLLGKPPLKNVSDSIKLLIEGKKNIPSLSSLAPEISQETCDIVDSMLAFDKLKRYQNYEDLIADLKTASENIANSNGSRMRKTRSAFFRKRARKKQRLVILSGIASIFLISIIAITITLCTREKPAPTPPIQPAIKQDVKTESDYIIKTFHDAESLIKQGKISTVIPIFKSLYLEPKNSVAMASWCALQNAICHWILNKETDVEEGVQALKTLQDIIQNTPKDQRSTRIESLNTLANWLLTSNNEELDVLPSTVALDLVLSELAAGLRCVQSKEWRRAQQYLEHFCTLSYPDNPEWLESYKKLIQPALKYLDEFNKLSTIPRKNSEEQRIYIQAIKKLNRESKGWDFKFTQELETMELGAKRELQTTVDQERQAERQRAQRAAAQRAAEEKRMAAEKKKPTSYTEAQEAKDSFRKRWDFTTGKSILEKALKIPGYPKEFKPSFTAIISMADEANAFLNMIAEDIKPRQTTIPMTLQDDSPVTIVGAQGGQLVTADGPIDWHDLSVKSIINVHSKLTNLIKDKKLQMQRHSHAIVFLYLIGDIAEAKDRAAKLSEIDDDFAEKWAQWMQILQQ